MKTSFDLLKNLNENALPKIKKTRVLSEREKKLNEGAGAGYNITGTIDEAAINSFKVVETTEDKYGIPTYLVDCDISATLEDVTFESYYDGGHVDSAQIKITKLCLADNHEPEEKGELNNYNIQQSLDGTKVKSLIGGGWVHQTFDGYIDFDLTSYEKDNAEGSVYSDFYVLAVEYHFIDEDLIKFIDLAVQGENVVEEYIVYAEDYDELDRFDSEEKAIEFAKNTPNAMKVEQYSYRYEFDGDIDINSEYSETVWEKDDFEESEHINESEKLEEKLNGNEIMVFSKKAIEAESEEELKKIVNEIRYYSEPTYTRCMEIINGDGSVQYKAGQISDIIFQLNESEEHDLSKDLLGDEANKRKSEDQRTLETYLQLANEIKDGKNDTITLDSAKELVKNAYIKAKGYLSFEPEEIDKRIAKDIPELFGELEESAVENIDYKEAAKKIHDISTEEIVQELVKNDNCDKRLKNIAKQYNELEATSKKFNNYDELEDKFIELDNKAEEIIAELAGIDISNLEESNLKESENKISYQDLVAAGESLWRDDATIYKTNVDGIWDCHTAGHGGYLVDATKFPELAKYGDKTSVDNIVGFEEDYEALKVIWVVPEVLPEKILSNNNFIKNLTIDQVTKYDNNDNFKNEFPDKKVKDNLDESEDSDKEKEIAELEAEIKKKVAQYAKSQKEYNGDNAESDRLEGEIDSLELKLKKLKESEELIEEEIVSDKLTEVKSQGNVYMLQDNDKYIVGEDYNKEENLIENAEIYTNKEEADKDYFSRCDITRDGEQVDPTEQNLGIESQSTEEA